MKPKCLRKKFDLINLPQDPRLFQELTEAIAGRSVDPIFTHIRHLPFKRNVVLRTPSKPDGTLICYRGNRAYLSRAVAILQIVHVFNARPTEAYLRTAFSLISLLAADVQVAFHYDTGIAKPLLVALRPKASEFDFSFKYG